MILPGWWGRIPQHLFPKAFKALKHRRLNQLLLFRALRFYGAPPPLYVLSPRVCVLQVKWRKQAVEDVLAGKELPAAKKKGKGPPAKKKKGPPAMPAGAKKKKGPPSMPKKKTR